MKQSTEYDRTRIRAFNTVKEDINEEEECKDDSSKQERRKIPQNSINDQVVENEEEEIEESQKDSKEKRFTLIQQDVNHTDEIKMPTSN